MRSLLRPFWLALAGAAGPAGAIVLPAAVLALLGILLLLASSVRAHSWYEELKNAGGADCCGDRDCAPYPHRHTPGELGFELLIDGQWVPVPPDVVLGMFSPDGNAHACCWPGGCEAKLQRNGRVGLFRCVVVPGAAS